MTFAAINPRVLVAAGLVLLGLGSCFAEPDGSKPSGTGGMSASNGGMSSEGGAGAGAEDVCSARPAKEGAKCNPVRSAELLHSKLVDDAPRDAVVFVDDLYQQFKSNCGGCHIDGSLGGFHVSNKVEFRDRVDRKVLGTLRSDTRTCEKGPNGQKLDPACLPFMPPVEANGKPWSEREDDGSDAIRGLSTLMELWLDAKSPLDVFTLPAELGGKTAYPVDEAMAASLTNLGTCVPDQGMVATELERSCSLDAMFAALKRVPGGAPHERIGLPRTLNETDLFTLDGAALAQHGVIGYAPTYPLWTDDAGKLRFVRVPRGKSISYNPQTRNFDIPENTRFYKTFLKEVTTLTGEKRFRKVETRVIVSRAGAESLFGTYAWNEQETEAKLVDDPLRNGEPFRDRLLTLVTNEPVYQDIYARVQSGELRNLSYELDQAKAVRRYAIPGSERCIQCHMGQDSFILGFSPLQVHRRPCDQKTLDEKGHCEGGILEPAGPDEVTQLERLIQYGVITNFDTAKDLQQLEDPQGKRGSRPVRTPEELVAQGYLLGNCSHCHNPNGYPSVLNPELADLLDFLPSEKGGIFGFPLDRVSPRIKRGPEGEISLPYITPSLRDIIPRSDSQAGWFKKATSVLGPNGDAVLVFIDAPWRSLIYRNVDTPFTYTDDSTIYPHMPLNSPGFDCRAPRIMGDWMVSIPAKRKNPALSEELSADLPSAESDPQPFVEVKAEDPGYLNASAEARKRLAIYRKGDRYKSYCPDTSDIVDLNVERKVSKDYLTPRDGSVKGMPIDGVPDRSHWTITDLTEVPGPWYPRRADWKEVLVDQNFTAGEAEVASYEGTARVLKQTQLDNQKLVVAMLKDITFSKRMEEFARTKIPFGLWVEKEECSFDGVPTLGDFKGAERRRWMNVVDGPNLQPEKPVYEAVPGALVYNMICVNCHGPAADSRGRQATTLQDMTGGDGRVANFRDGLFGPFGEGGANRKRVFGSDDQARGYLAWMALGGTNTQIPTAILELVARTPVLGEKRGLSNAVSSANMLQVAQALCASVATLGTNRQPFDIAELGSAEQPYLHDRLGLIEKNGDADFWKELCSIDNPPPIRVLRADRGLRLEKANLFWPQAYPASAPIGDHLGRSQPALSADNWLPWCVQEPDLATEKAWLEMQRTNDSEPKPLPRCPAEFVVEANRYSAPLVDGVTKDVDIQKWAARGAINAGFVVFAYVDQLVGGGNEPIIGYNECEKL